MAVCFSRIHTGRTRAVAQSEVTGALPSPDSLKKFHLTSAAWSGMETQSSFTNPQFCMDILDVHVCRSWTWRESSCGNMTLESCCKWSVTNEVSMKHRSSRLLRSLLYKTIENFVNPTAWSEFTGEACPFIILQEALERVNRQKAASDSKSRPIHEIALDLETTSRPNSLRIPELPEFPIVGFEVELLEQN